MELVQTGFPNRPLMLRRGSSGIGALAGGLLGGLLFVTLTGAGIWYFLPDLLSDGALSAAGIDVLDGRVEGRCETRKAVFTTCDLHVHYLTHDRRWHDHEVHLLLLGKIDDSAPLHIRYAKANAELVGTSWGADALTNRWITLVGLAVLLTILAGSLVWTGIRGFRIGRSLAAAARAPQPIAVTLTGVKGDRRRRTWSYTWSDGGRARTGSRVLKIKAEPLLLDAAGTRALALLAPDGRAHLLAKDFDPVMLTATEQQSVRAALAGAFGRLSPVA